MQKFLAYSQLGSLLGAFLLWNGPNIGGGPEGAAMQLLMFLLLVTITAVSAAVQSLMVLIRQ